MAAGASNVCVVRAGAGMSLPVKCQSRNLNRAQDSSAECAGVSVLMMMVLGRSRRTSCHSSSAVHHHFITSVTLAAIVVEGDIQCVTNDDPPFVGLMRSGW